MKSSGGAKKVGANFGSAAVCRIAKAALSNILEVISFYHTGKTLYLGKTS